MSEQTPRELLAEADRERRTAEACESLQREVRLGGSVALKRGLFGRRRDDGRVNYLTGAESRAVYLALRIVRQEAEARADALEARVTAEVPE